MINYSKITRCRICNSSNLKSIIDLGSQPLANNLQKNFFKKELKIPLKVTFCKVCKTSQLTHTVNPKLLFSKYLWVTKTSSVVKKYSKFFVRKVLKHVKINSKPFILEIASNDGTFLKEFKNQGCKVLGIDPAKNISNKANKSGIKTVSKFFNEETALFIKKNYNLPDLIFARNVIPHVAEIHSVVKGISNLCSKNTLVCIEFHYAKFIIQDLHYDSIYHEHLFYFTLETITNLFKKYNLLPYDCFLSPISGGSIVLFFSKNKKKKSNKLLNIINVENKLKLNNILTWKNFNKKIIKHSIELNKCLEFCSKKTKIIGYGASARSSTLLNFLKINNNNIEFIIDKNKLKENLFTPGSKIKILSFESGITKISNHFILILAWNFEKEIISALKERLKKFKIKTKFIIPLPKIKII